MFRNSKTKVFYRREKSKVVPLIDLKVFCYSRKRIKYPELTFDKVLENLEKRFKVENFCMLVIGREKNEPLDEDELETDKKAIGVEFEEGKVYRQVMVFDKGWKTFNEKDLLEGNL